MAVIGKLTLYEHWDVDKFQQKLDAEETLYLEVERRYPVANVPEVVTVVLPLQFGTDYMNALIVAVDAATFAFEQDCIVWKVNTVSGSYYAFDLSGSYKRTAVDDTEAVAAGTVLLAVFTTAGLPDSVRTTVQLPFGQAISSADKIALSDVGIVLAAGATGTAFTITSKTPFTVQFYQPAAATVNYVVDFAFTNTIIAP